MNQEWEAEKAALIAELELAKDQLLEAGREIRDLNIIILCDNESRSEAMRREMKLRNELDRYRNSNPSLLTRIRNLFHRKSIN